MRPRIAVIGSANIDLTTFTDRFPKPGETIFGQKFDLGFGGKGANQAVAARLCGGEVLMVARVGNDLFGPATIENFNKLGIDTTHVKQVEGLSSGVAPIFVEPNGQNRMFVVKGANEALNPADVDAAAEALRSADCIVLQFEIPLDTVYHAVAFARQHGIRCILNPAPGQAGVDMAALADLDYFVPNETDMLHAIRSSPSSSRALVLAITNSPESFRLDPDCGPIFAVRKPIREDEVSGLIRAGYSTMLRERRQYFRCHLMTPVQIGVGSETVVLARTTNLSAGGMAIETEFPMQAGANVAITFTLPEGEVRIEALAQVVWTDQRAKVGFRFLKVAPEMQRALDEWLSAKFYAQLQADGASFVNQPVLALAN